MFPTLVNYEQYTINDLFNVTDNLEIIWKLINDTQMNNDHGVFNSYLSSIISILWKSEINWKNINEFELLKSTFENINNEMKNHTLLENKYLYFKWIKLQEKLKNQLESLNMI